MRLSLEARRREDEEHVWLEAEEEACLVEEAKLKYEEEEQARLRDDEEARLAEEARRKAEEHKCAWLKV